MADTENEINFSEGFVEQRLEGGGVGGEADAEVDVGSDDASELAGRRRGRELGRGKTGEGFAEKGHRPARIGRIAIRMMVGGERGHGS